MSISFEDKEAIFLAIKEDFGWVQYKPNAWLDEGFDEYNLHEKGYSYECGTTKVCIFHDNFAGYVVKFCDEVEFDYCEREYTNYLAAKEKGFDKFFPYTDFLIEINGIKFFIQEEAYCNESEVSSLWYDELRRTYDGEETEEIRIQDEICNWIYNLEDYERVILIFHNDALADFLFKYRINDIHEGNIGFINNEPVIIDFSGYGQKVRERGF